MFELAAADAENLKKSHPELAAQLEVVRAPGGAETLASLRVPSARGAIVQKKAASLWPYKLVATVLERLVARHPAPSFNLQTNTPVTSLSRADPGPGWTLTTPRGRITARQVLLATNGYTSHLLPAFADLIVPVRGQIGALLPPAGADRSADGPEAAAATQLTHSYVFAADPEPGSAPAAPRDDYLVQRPPRAGGVLIYGGGRRLARRLGVGEWRDDEVEPDVAGYLRRELCPPLDLSPTVDAEKGDGEEEGDEGKEKKKKKRKSGGLELEASFEWTGVMGYSRDRHAWVGPVPESLGGGGPGGGLWVCAGYTGHGMPAAALSAREVARQMSASWDGKGVAQGEEVEGDGDGKVRLPREFVLDEERVERARGLPQLTQGWEATNFATLFGSGSSAPPASAKGEE
ncbi:hypothetical protein VTH06DRAFT_8613 [Thermothelomyces fergusii]